MHGPAARSDAVSDKFAQARAHFPGAASGVYADVAARGLIPLQAKRAAEAQLDARMRGSADKHAMFATIERVRERYARLIGAHPDEIAYTKNVSEGLNIVAAALDWRVGDNVVLCPELEHPSNLYPWFNLKARRGIEIRAVPARDGRMPVDEMIAALDARTRLVTTSLVTFAPGLRTDVARLAEACAARAVPLLVDAAQGIGILDLDMDAVPIAAMSVSTQKGLLGLYGMGFLYVRRAFAETLSPAYLSRFGVDLGTAHEAASGDESYRLMPAARRFEVGNYNFLAAIALEPGLDLILSLGTKAIEPYVVGLADRLAQDLEALGLPVFAGEPGPHRAHMVAVGHGIGARHDATDDQAMQSLYAAFTEAGVRLSIRRGVLRLSLHCYNNEDDVAHIVDVARRWRARGSV